MSGAEFWAIGVACAALGWVLRGSYELGQQIRRDNEAFRKHHSIPTP